MSWFMLKPGAMPPLGENVWALVENPVDGEPYLVEGASLKSGEGEISFGADDAGNVNYLPPNHTIIAFRSA